MLFAGCSWCRAWCHAPAAYSACRYVVSPRQSLLGKGRPCCHDLHCSNTSCVGACVTEAKMAEHKQQPSGRQGGTSMIRRRSLAILRLRAVNTIASRPQTAPMTMAGPMAAMWLASWV